MLGHCIGFLRRSKQDTLGTRCWKAIPGTTISVPSSSSSLEQLPVPLTQHGPPFIHQWATWDLLSTSSRLLSSCSKPLLSRPINLLHLLLKHTHPYLCSSGRVFFCYLIVSYLGLVFTFFIDQYVKIWKLINIF